MTYQETRLFDSFRRLQPFRVLVLGDFLLDTYTTGRVRRISPEAPVPVMEVLSQESRPGGAGNVVLNLHALGGHVFCVGRLGADREGEILRNLLSLEKVRCDALVIEKGYKTPVKNRLIADSQQLLRVDLETIAPLDRSLEDNLIQQLEEMIPQVQIVALSDYGKGFLTDRLIRAAIEISKKHKISVIVDPKGIDFVKYRGATIIKPNLSEAYAAAKMPLGTSLDTVACELTALTSADFLLITRSEAGISVFEKLGKRQDFPVVSKEVKDVTGAGDTVLAVLCLSLANSLEMEKAVQLSNVAAGIAIERLGCVQVTLSEIAKRLCGFGNESKIFKKEQTFALAELLKGKRYSLLVLSEGQQMSLALFRAIRKFSANRDGKLIVYVSDLHPQEEFVHFLCIIREIDHIVLRNESLKHLCDVIRPFEVFVLKGENAIQIDDAQDILQSLASVPMNLS